MEPWCAVVADIRNRKITLSEKYRLFHRGGTRKMITDKEFLDWYDGQEGFALRSERAVEELEPSNILKLRQWMFAAFEAGRASRNVE
jgi:hypothetical protein